MRHDENADNEQQETCRNAENKHTGEKCKNNEK